MSENTPTVQDFALEVLYTAAVVVAAGVTIYVAKKAVKGLKTIRLKKSEESA